MYVCFYMISVTITLEIYTICITHCLIHYVNCYYIYLISAMCYTYYSTYYSCIFCLIYYRVVVKIYLYQCQCQCHLVTKNRHASAHGGLAFYIHKNWNIKVNSYTIESLYWEEMFVELMNPANPSKTKFAVGNFYRPPHETVAQLKFISHKNYQCLILAKQFLYAVTTT